MTDRHDIGPDLMVVPSAAKRPKAVLLAIDEGETSLAAADMHADQGVGAMWRGASGKRNLHSPDCLSSYPRPAGLPAGWSSLMDEGEQMRSAD